MADRDRFEGWGSERDRWRDRDREPGWRTDDERRSFGGEDYGRGGYREGGTYGQGAWRGAGQRSIQHEDQRYGAHHDTGETWGQGRTYRDQMGREDFGQYGQTGAGGAYSHDREHDREHDVERGRRGQGYGSSRQFGPGGYGESASRGQGDYAGQSGGAFGAGGYGAYADEGSAGGAVGARLYGGYGQGGMGQTYGQSAHGQTFGATGREMGGDFQPSFGEHRSGDYGRGRDEHTRHGQGHSQSHGQSHGQSPGMSFASTHGEFEPDYLHWRDAQMQTLDQDYMRWREERRSKFAKDFDDWRKTQGARPGQHQGQHQMGEHAFGQPQPGQMRTAGQGASGGASDMSAQTNPIVDRVASGESGQHPHGQHDHDPHGQADKGADKKKS